MTIRRTHTAANVAPCLVTLQAQFDAAYPARRTTVAGTDSEGIWPSKRHSQLNPNSDHEGGNAWDCDDDLSGVDGKPPEITPVMAALISTDPRCKYAIHDGRIYSDGVGKAYGGSNPHTGHLHVSVYDATRADARAWDIRQGGAVDRTYKVMAVSTAMGGATARDADFESKLRALCVEYGKALREAPEQRALPQWPAGWYKLV